MTRVSVKLLDKISSRVTLSVDYEGGTAQIEMPLPEPLYDTEPTITAYRRELLSLLDALEVWTLQHDQVLT